MIEVGAHTTSVRFDGQTITISRRPKPGMSLIGAGDTVIPLASVQSIEWKPAGRLSLGHIRFAVPGSQGAAASTPVNRDAHAVVFGRKHMPLFEKLRDTVQEALVSR
jgi:hypothetical protein